MKKIMKFYERSKMSITIAYVGFILLAIGFLLQNKNVNLFYTFKSSIVLMTASFVYKLGQIIVINLPLIFMTNNVCKKANSGEPIILSFVGYFTFLITTMLFTSTGLQSYAYTQTSGINTIISTAGMQISKYPLETGLIGSFIVAYCVRLAYIQSRTRSEPYFLSFIGPSITATILTIILCFITGVITAYVFPFFYKYLQVLIEYISKDLMSPIRIGLYGILDRLLSMLGLGNAIRYPFWYTTAGGSYSTLAGSAVLGDVNIWEYVQGISATYSGAGRFITPYYVINIFIIPGIYIGMLLAMSDKQERRNYLFLLIALSILSILAGNPLPLELLLLFTAPLLLIFYLLEVGIIFGLLIKFEAFLGFSPISTDTVTAMPGAFPDFIINLRNYALQDTIFTIFKIGIFALAITVLIVAFYYRFLAYDIVGANKLNTLCDRIVDAMSGTENILDCGSGFLKLNIYLQETEKADFEKIKKLGATRIRETRDGFSFDFGSSSYKIARRLKEMIKANKRV